MPWKRLEAFVVLASSLILVASLGLFAWAGFSARYWADDYCYGAWVRTYGLTGAVLDWYLTSGNRLSTLAGVALSELFGMHAVRWVPLVVLLLLVVSWMIFLRQLWQLIRPGRTTNGSAWLTWLWLALVQVYFLALLAPDRLQTIYWRMGTLHYTLPLALLLLILALCAWAARKAERWLWPAAFFAGLLAFFAAGFSETYAALQVGVFVVILLAIGWRAWRQFGAGNMRPRLALVGLAGLPLLGTLLMMAIMASAPANAWRQAVMPPPDNLLLVIPYSLRYALDFIVASLASRPVPYALYLLAMAAFSLLWWADERQPRLAPRAAIIGLVLSLLLTYFWIVCSFAPSAYAGLLYPAGRAQMPAAFILLAGLGLAAGLSAALLRVWLVSLAGRVAPGRGPGLVWGVALLLLAAASLYPLRMASIPRSERAALAVRAERFDARDAQIRAALAEGIREVQVRQTDVVQSLEDLGPDPSFWINACAALYYGAGSIKANP